MFKPLLKVYLVLSLLLLGMSAAAFASCTSGSQLSLSVNPATADAGDSVTVASGVHNTTTHAELVTVKYALTVETSTATNTISLGEFTFPLAAGKSVSESRTFTLPTPAPLGTYILKGSAAAGGSSVGSCRVSLSVVANDGD